MRTIILLPALLLSSAALAQAEGSFPGILSCDAGLGMAGARVPVTVNLEGMKANYSFPAPSPAGQPSATAEKGAGTLAPGGALVLTGSAKGPGFSYQARYAGEIGGRGGMLAGTQTGTAGGKSFTRRCQMSLGNGRG